jgi:hypothetical protein
MSAACLDLDGTACAPNVEFLYIRNCPNFTIPSLRRFVSARLEPLVCRERIFLGSVNAYPIFIITPELFLRPLPVGGG